MVTNLAAFGVVMIASQTLGSDEIADYAGLSLRSPALALVMLVAFLSLAGVPPLGGFIAKVLVFAAAVQADMVWLAVVGVLNAIIGIYYYLIVLKVILPLRYRQAGQTGALDTPANGRSRRRYRADRLPGHLFCPLVRSGAKRGGGAFLGQPVRNLDCDIILE